jgi:hypothetical protein
MFGEPRSTADVDVAIRLDPALGEPLLGDMSAEFHVPVQAARAAIRSHESFNLGDTTQPMKVDVFVLGDGLLDRRQIDRRMRIALPGSPHGIWVTSPEDQVLRKLDWYRLGGEVSDRQWRDVIGLLAAVGREFDRADITAAAAQLGLVDLLEAAFAEASEMDAGA